MTATTAPKSRVVIVDLRKASDGWDEGDFSLSGLTVARGVLWRERRGDIAGHLK
jgi:hypothetical protein